MAVASDVNYEELARSTDEFNGAQLKAVCVEAGMIALREGATKLSHEHFLSGIAEGTFSHISASVVLDLMGRYSAEQEEEPAQLFHVVFLSWLLGCRFRNVPFSFRTAYGLRAHHRLPRNFSACIMGICPEGTSSCSWTGFRLEDPCVGAPKAGEGRRQSI